MTLPRIVLIGRAIRAMHLPVPGAVLRLRVALFALLAVAGPGLVSGFADNDAGGITTYSVVGAQFGYDLLWVLLASMVALAITQEVGARLGLATGQGLVGLIREQFGLHWSMLAIVALLIANLGDTVAEYAGIAAALAIFGVPVPLSAAVAAIFIVVLLTQANFGQVQLLFVIVGFGVSLAYGLSAALAHPQWGSAAQDLVLPRGNPSAAYLLAVVGTVGTTITPWGQSFIQSYVADKKLGPRHLTSTRVDVCVGSFLTNLVAGFIILACAATLWANGHTQINDAAQAARALGPLLGGAATLLFAVGLLAASLLGLGTVPLTSAYAITEALGLEAGLDHPWGEARIFYGLLSFFVGFAALFVLVPGLPLIQVMFLSQVLDGLLLPVILVFVFLLAANRQLLGDLWSGGILLFLGWLVTFAVSLMSVLYVVSTVLGR